MKFYHIMDAYISFLRKYDSKVAENKSETRPYVGIVLDINGIKYYAPFTSPKPKHLTMKNTVDFRKIKHGEYGAINLSNMIPVPESALIEMDISSEPDEHYRNLLYNQYREIESDSAAIENSAKKLRVLILKEVNNINIQKIKAHCCDLRILESVYMKFEK